MGASVPAVWGVQGVLEVHIRVCTWGLGLLAQAVVVQEGIPDGVRHVGACQCAQGYEHEWHMLGL